LSYIKGNNRFVVTDEEKIWFYNFDPETLMPSLENVMWNFMGCTQM